MRDVSEAPAQPPAPVPSAPPPAATPAAVHPAAPPPKKRDGAGSAIGGALAAATRSLVQLTSKLFGEVAERAGEFRARPEHSRWRAYALGSYGLLLAATLLGQAYDDNVLKANVRVQHVELPAVTEIFVRNNSKRAWNNVRLTLNGMYTWEQPSVGAGDHVLVAVDKFAIVDGSGKSTRAPKNVVPKLLEIDTDGQHFETELKP